MTGARDEETVRQAYRAAGIPHAVCGFLNDMRKAYGVADWAVARSGAATCSELAICGVPALLVPLPTARRDHQTANARALEDAGAADRVAQSELTSEWLADYLDRCRRDEPRRAGMQAALRALAVPDAAVKLAALVEETARMGAG